MARAGISQTLANRVGSRIVTGTSATELTDLLNLKTCPTRVRTIAYARRPKLHGQVRITDDGEARTHSTSAAVISTVAPVPGTVPDKFTKIRIGFNYDEQDRAVAWFFPKEDDLYWGPATAGRYGGSHPIDGRSFTVTVPDDLDEQDPASSKFSYHESGQAHHKVDGRMEGGPGRLRVPRDVSEPLLLSALITKPPVRYRPGRNLTHRGAHALRLHVDEETAQQRHYFEFAVAPEGTFPSRPLLISAATPPPVYTASVSDHLILVVRHAILGGPKLAEWQPEMEIWINHVNDPDSAVAVIEAFSGGPS